MTVKKLLKNINIYSPKQTKKQTRMRNSILAFTAVLSGIVIGITAALVVAIPMIKSEMSAQAVRTVSLAPADDVLSACTQPTVTTTGPVGQGQVLGASTNVPVPSTSSTSGSSTPFISKLVSGDLTTSTISNTGPQSSNTITTTNTDTTTVTNTNDINVSSNNFQTASTGNATTSNNTTGGSATSGNADNSNSSSVTIDINN